MVLPQNLMQNIWLKKFIEEKNYKKILQDVSSQSFASEASGPKKNGRGGHNKQLSLDFW